MSTILRSKEVITRKSHKCFGCNRSFPKGTKMLSEGIADAGTVFNCYLCPTCVEIMYDMEYGDEFCRGDLHDEAIEREENII